MSRQRLIGLKYERDPKRGTRGKPGGFLLIENPNMGTHGLRLARA
jgi:hypothetical protein